MTGTVQKVERVRGPELAILVKRSEGVPIVEGLKRADEKNLVIASNARMSKALVGSNEWRKISDVFACWTGTMTAYTKPGEKLREVIEYVDPDTKQKWVFRVPKEFQKEKNAILVSEHPDYKVEVDGKTLVVHATVVDLVADFPAKTQKWYAADSKHGIPTGKEVEYSQDARYLWRVEQRVGPVARDYGYSNVDGRSDWQGVGLDGRPSGGLGVAVEAAEGGAPLEVKAPEPAPIAEKKAIIEVKGLAADELKGMLEGFSKELSALGKVAKDELLENSRKLEAALKGASLKE